MTFARRFLSSLSHSQNLSFLVEAGNIAHLFRDTEKADYQAVREHVTKYGKIPAPATLATILGEPVLEQAEPPGFYLDLMVEQHVELSVKRAMQRANELFADADKKPTDALEMMIRACGGLIVENMGSKIVDMREAEAAIWTEYARTLAGSDDDVFTGWPTLDAMLAGLRVTDLISIIGRPGAGKSWTAVYIAHYVWRMLKRPVLFVSMEMDRLQMQQRFAALYSMVPFGDLKRAELTSVGQQMLKTSLLEMKGLPFPLWIVDGHLTSTVDDIATLAIQRKPALVILDGAYLMRHARETDIYKRVAMTTEQIKRDVAKVCPVIATYQFSRESTKKKDAASVGLEDIAYSDVIGQMSSLVLGLLEPKIAENEIVSDPKKKVYILKGRNGEIGSFEINWRFAPQMNFGEGSVEHQKLPLFKFAV